MRIVKPMRAVVVRGGAKPSRRYRSLVHPAIIGPAVNIIIETLGGGYNFPMTLE